ncbi:MAG: hypothetical protein EOL97_11730 [Spirochaetia bacterium]|nr:hypothetical protein [Spirochaetia bacterium]
MGLFDFLKHKKNIEPIVEEIPQNLDTKTFINKECELCKKIIGYEHYSKQQGKYFHKKCYKNALSQVRNSGVVVK